MKAYLKRQGEFVSSRVEVKPFLTTNLVELHIMDCFDMQLLLTLFFVCNICPAVYMDTVAITTTKFSNLDRTYTNKIINRLGFRPVRHNSTFMEKIRKSLPEPITLRINRQNAFHPTPAPNDNRDIMIVGEHSKYKIST